MVKMLCSVLCDLTTIKIFFLKYGKKVEHARGGSSELILGRVIREGFIGKETLE